MDITLKYKIVEKIIQTEDDALLNEIKSLIGFSESDFWTELLEEVIKAIDKAKIELDRGDGIPHSKVMDEINARFANR